MFNGCQLNQCNHHKDPHPDVSNSNSAYLSNLSQPLTYKLTWNPSNSNTANRSNRSIKHPTPNPNTLPPSVYQTPLGRSTSCANSNTAEAKSSCAAACWSVGSSNRS